MKSRITFLMLFCLTMSGLKAQTCTDGLTISTDHFGADVTIFAEDFIDGAIDGVTYSVSPSVVTCADAGSTLDVTITGSDGFTCTSEISVNDNTPPVVVVTNLINLSLSQDGTAVLHPETVDDGSYDTCSELEFLTLSQTEFTASDLGENTVFLAAQDIHGNNNVAYLTVIVSDQFGPEISAVESIELQLEANPNGFPSATLSVEDVDLGTTDNTGIQQQELSQTVFGCEDVGTNTVDYAVMDLDGNVASVSIEVTVLAAEVTGNPNLACNEEVSVYVSGDEYITITAKDVLEGGPYRCATEYDLSITDSNGDVVVNNVITSAYADQSLMYQVSDFLTGNSCWGIITVGGVTGGCAVTEDQISWPDHIHVSTDVPPLTLTPDYLMSLGFEEAQVRPLTDVDCAVLGMSHNDQVFILDEAAGISKILREWFVIDWTSTQVFENYQIIKINYDNPASNSLICDILPRTAPVGDCDSGHTLDDDVEWPGDLVLSDHRIEPVDLAWLNLADIEDVRPMFFGNNAEFYQATYVDVLGGLSSTILTVNREWTVTRPDLPNLSWTYTQKLDIDFGQFSNLVTVNTLTNKPVPNVNLTDDILTNENGVAIVNDEATLNPQRLDSSMNGLDALDLALVYAHILGHETLTPEQVEIADVNDNGALTTLDLVLIQKMLLEEDGYTSEWVFNEATEAVNNTVSPRAHFRAYKQGDVDESALLDGNLAGYDTDVNFEDVLLNAGESYVIPLEINEEVKLRTFELRLKIDPSLVEVEKVYAGDDAEVISRVDEESGRLIIIYAGENIDALENTNRLVEITLKAKENSILHFAMDFDNQARSFIVNEEFERIFINGEVQNSINVDVHDIAEVDFVTVYPNPVVNQLVFDVDESVISDYEVRVFNTNGHQVYQNANVNKVDFANYPTGTYLVALVSGDNYYTKMIIKE